MQGKPTAERARPALSNFMWVRVQAEFSGDIAGPFYDQKHSLDRLPMYKISEWLAKGWKVTLTETKK